MNEIVTQVASVSISILMMTISAVCLYGWVYVIRNWDSIWNKKPFDESVHLLRQLSDLQNGPPLEKYKHRYETTMKEITDFLEKWEK